MLCTNREGQGHRARIRMARRSALVALLAAMTCQGTFAAESQENRLAHSRPPLPVETDSAPAPRPNAPPRANPYFSVPPADELVTLTGGELPEPTLLRPTSSKLTLLPVDREQPLTAVERSSSTIQLGQPRQNAFAFEAAQSSRSQGSPRAASQASFDHDERISEADGAVSFSFSDATGDASPPPESKPTAPSEASSSDKPAVADDSQRESQPSPTKLPAPPNSATALLPEQVREASPVQLAPLDIVDEAKNAPVVIAKQRGAAGKQGPSQRAAKESAPSDEAMPIPTLSRPVDPIVVEANSAQSPRGEKVAEAEIAMPLPVDEGKRDRDEDKSDELDQRSINGAPIVIERGAVARIGRSAVNKAANSPVVTEGSLVVIDVPSDAALAAPRPLSQPASPAQRVARLETSSRQDDSKSTDDAQPEAAAQVGTARQPKSAPLSVSPVKASQPDPVSALSTPPKPERIPQSEIEHLAGDEDAATGPATEDFLAAHPTAGEVMVAAAEVGSLLLEKPVHCFAVENSSICQVMASQSAELRIIGQRKGKTRIAVWHGPRQSTQPLLYTVQVTGTAENERQSLLVAANKLNLSLLQTFPGVDVRVTAGEGKLTVHGSAQGDEQARRILRLIRQACLVPVIDEIVVR